MPDYKYKTMLLNGTDREIKKASNCLKDGELVIFPTETVYGIGADASSDISVKKVFEVKGRPEFNPLIVHLEKPEDINDYAVPNELAELLITNFFPGPLTLILSSIKNTKLSHLVTSGLKTVALRVPEESITNSLIKKFGGPIAAPSANLSGKISATRFKDVVNTFNGKVSSIIRGDDCRIGIESTIISCVTKNPVLLRPGGLKIELIEDTIKNKLIVLNSNQKNFGNILSPGQLTSHYAPNANMRLNAFFPMEDEVYLGFGRMPKNSQGISLSLSSDISEAGLNLFAALNDLDALCHKLGKNKIAVSPIPYQELGIAINDRLTRAAASRD